VWQAIPPICFTLSKAKDGEKEKIIYEVADLWFHTLVLLRHKDIEIAKT
jgi:phosphoribosyl-ATP pyrophosphohydrolase